MCFFSISPQVSTHVHLCMHSSPVGKAPVPLLAICVCIGKGPSTITNIYVCTIHSFSIRKNPLTYCISSLRRKGPRSGSLFLSMCVSHLYIPSATEGPRLVSLLTSMCVLCIPSPTEGLPSCVITRVHVCIYSPSCRKGPVLVLMCMCVCIFDFFFLFLIFLQDWRRTC